MDFIAFITSYLETGPTVTYDTGIFYLLRYYKSAYRDPRVEAATPTPVFSSFIFFLTVSN